MKWTVGQRIAVGFGVGLALVVLVAAIGVFVLRRTIQSYDEVLEQQQRVQVVALEAQSEVRDATVHFLRFLLLGDESLARHRDDSLTAARGLIDSVRDAVAHDEDRAAWTEALRALAEWDRVSSLAMRARSEGRTAEVDQIHEQQVYPARLQVSDAIRGGVTRAAQRADAVIAAANANSSRMQTMLVATALFVLICGALAGWLLARAVSRPLQETSSVLASSAAEILAATQQQGAGTAETSAAVAETVTTVEEVTQTADQASQRAQAVAESARRAADMGKQGRAAVEHSVAATKAVKEQVESIAASILALAEQAQAIGEIIASVNDIAEQTNLLALNASVEAARAGEHGRGFAVVAAEIKSLAGESKKATVQVRQILGEIQRATSAAVMTTEQGTKDVGVVTRQVEESGEAIRALVDAIGEAAQMSAQIMASAGQQAVGMSQIRMAMSSIQDAMQQSLTSTRQSERAAQDLSELGARLVELVGARARGPVRERSVR
jgi:methyl-accepting chemotaxis protein